MKYISFATNIHHQNILANKEADFPLTFIVYIRAAKLRCLQGRGSDINRKSGAGPSNGVSA